MPKIIPICFGGNGPDSADVEEHGDHHNAGREDHAAGVGQAADHRLARVVAGVPVLLPLSARLAVSRAVDAYGKAERAHSGQLRSDRPSFWTDADACRT